MLTEEMMRNGYPSLLILGRDTDTSQNIKKSSLKKTTQKHEMKDNLESDKFTTQPEK